MDVPPQPPVTGPGHRNVRGPERDPRLGQPEPVVEVGERVQLYRRPVPPSLDLAAQFRIAFPDPDYAAEGFAAATLDRDNLARLLGRAESHDAGAVLGDVVGAGHFQVSLMLVVPASDTNWQRYVDAFSQSVGDNEFAGAVTHNFCRALCAQ